MGACVSFLLNDERTAQRVTDAAGAADADVQPSPTKSNIQSYLGEGSDVPLNKEGAAADIVAWTFGATYITIRSGPEPR